MNQSTETKLIELARGYGLTVASTDAAALEKFTDEIMRRTQAVEAKYEPNVVYAYGTDGSGKKTWQMITGNGDSPNQIISTALELVRAIRRGIDIPPGVLYKHLVGKEYVAPTALSGPNVNSDAPVERPPVPDAPPTPPSNWDEWAMAKAPLLLSELSGFSYNRKINTIHCALIEAMRFAKGQQP